MRLTEARRQLRAIGWTIRRLAAGDYRVNVSRGKESSAYYTEDLDDAVDTAKIEARVAGQIERARAAKARRHLDPHPECTK